MKPMRMLLAATALLFTFGTVAVASAHDGGSKDKPSFPMKADEFQKRITVQELTPDGLRSLGPTAATLARLEGLDAHANAALLRSDMSL